MLSVSVGYFTVYKTVLHTLPHLMFITQELRFHNDIADKVVLLRVLYVPWIWRLPLGKNITAMKVSANNAYS